MALIVRDSFDSYADLTDLTTGPWDFSRTSGNGGFQISQITRFGTGGSLAWGSTFGRSIALQKTFDTNEQTIFITFAMFCSSFTATAVLDYNLRFFADDVGQCGVAFAANGDIYIYRGDIYGARTQIAVVTASYPSNSWTHWQIKIVIDTTNGEIHIRKNGNTVDDFSATGLNTQATASAYVNKFDLGSLAGSNITVARYTDDIAIYGASGVGPWNDWVGDIRAVQLLAYTDTNQKDFTNPYSIGELGLSTQTGTNTYSFAANTVYTGVTRQVTNGGGSWDTITASLNANVTGHLRAAVYDSDGTSGQPNSLLAVSDILTNPTAGLINFTFDSSPDFLNAHNYFIAIMGDASFVLKAGVSGTRYSMANAFSGGFPGTFTPTTITGNNPVLYATVAMTNAGQINESIFDPNTILIGSNNGDVDLYNSTGSANTPSSILGVSIRALMYKTDVGYREGGVILTSDDVPVEGPAIPLSRNYLEVRLDQDTDPASGMSWTVAGINNFQFGPKVTA